VAQENHTVPDQTPDPGIPTTNHRTSPEGTSRPSRVAIHNDDSMFDFKKDPPAPPTDRENMQVPEIKAIFDSHSIPYHEDFTKSQLLYILDQTFPVSGAPGRPFYYDALNDRFSWDDPRGSLPPGWEARPSRAGEKYYYDTINNTPSWNELRITKSNESGESRSERVLFPQNISGPQIPPSRSRPLETGKSHPTKPPEGLQRNMLLLTVKESMAGKHSTWSVLVKRIIADMYLIGNMPTLSLVPNSIFCPTNQPMPRMHHTSHKSSNPVPQYDGRLSFG
jgi:hypothetical protein